MSDIAPLWKIKSTELKPFVGRQLISTETEDIFEFDFADDLKMYSKPIRLSEQTELGRNALVLGRFDPLRSDSCFLTVYFCIFK